MSQKFPSTILLKAILCYTWFSVMSFTIMSVADLNVQAGKYVFSVTAVVGQNVTKESRGSFYAVCNNKKFFFNPDIQESQYKISFAKDPFLKSKNKLESLCFIIDDNSNGKICPCAEIPFLHYETKCHFKTSNVDYVKDGVLENQNSMNVALLGGTFAAIFALAIKVCLNFGL